MNSNLSYSPEKLNLGQIWRFLEPCDVEIWWWISSQNEFKSWFMTSVHIQSLSNTSMIHNLQSRSQHPIAIFKCVMLGSWGILRGPVARICILEGCSVSSLMNLTLLTRTFNALPIFKADFYLNRRNGINNLALYNFAVGFASLSEFWTTRL